MNTDAVCSEMKPWVRLSAALTWETLSSWQIQDRGNEETNTRKRHKEKGRNERLWAQEEEEEPVVKSAAVAMASCHELTCPSVLVLGQLRLFVDHHASDRHVRVLLFGLLYSLGQRLTPHTHTQTKQKIQLKKWTTQLNTRMKTQLNDTQTTGEHASATLDLRGPCLRVWGWRTSHRYGNQCVCVTE